MNSKEKIFKVGKDFPHALKILHLNAQSLTYHHHASEFQLLFDNSELDIIAVSETFFKDDCVLHLDGFNTFAANRTSHDGGGVVVYVKNIYCCKILSASKSPTVRTQQPDYVIFEISLKECKLLFACVYRPPKAGHFNIFANDFFSLCTDYVNYIVVGDVNAHFNSTKPCDIQDSKVVRGFIDECNLHHVPFGPTFHLESCHSHLDMIASSVPDRLRHFDQFPASPRCRGAARPACRGRHARARELPLSAGMAPREAEGPAAGLDGAGTTCPTTWSWRQRLRPPPGTRWRLPLLLALALAVAPAAAFCPAGCVCNTLRISCEDAGLDVVPFQLNPEASTITLRGNNILSVEYTVNFYQHLQQLDVSQNRLQSLGSKNFDALERLVSLNVSGNELGALGKDAFRGLRALRVLDLSDNLLEQLDRHAFAEMHDLWELHLRRNRLAAVADGVFDALVNLRVLQLADNQLLAVPSGALGRLTSLRALHLSGNLLEDLGAQAFAPLRELAALALANNVIAEVHPAALEGLVALERLDLADNNVTAVPTVPLASLRRLSYLDLSGNMFAAVGPGAFHGLAELRVLRLNRLVR
ncbi:hypothetical protein FOCC_FOCC002059 [Frankliniella occidentalis]|nr:hypothetical protein FOCC_FOCC002059 [Frankliniella occidentalis]